MNRLDILKTAMDLTGGERNKDYGGPVENHQHIASVFNAVTGHEITAADAAIFQVCAKLCRMRTSPMKADHYVDGAAYLGIAFECASAEGEQDSKYVKNGS